MIGDQYDDLIDSTPSTQVSAPKVKPTVDYRALYQDVGKKYNLDPDLLYNQAKHESINFNPHFVYGPGRSPKGAAGLAQFMPDTARQYGLKVQKGQDDRFNPIKAADAHGRLMRDLVDQYGDTRLALAAYNSGTNKNPQQAQRAMQRIPETKKYVQMIAPQGDAYDQLIDGNESQQPTPKIQAAQPKADPYDDLIDSVGQTQQPKTPQVTSSVRDDTGIEIPVEQPKPEPIKFQQADNSELNKVARSVQGLTDRVAMQNMELPKTHPDLLGQRITAKFDHQPTQEEVDDALMESLGKGYGGVAKKFREETGTPLTANNVAVDKQPDGSYLVHARPTQGFIDAVNAYAQGGRSAYEATLSSQQVGKANVARDVKTELKKGEGLGQDIAQAGAREGARNAQFIENLGSLVRGVAPEDNPSARAIARAEQSIPSQKTTTGSLAEIPISALGAMNRAEALGGPAGFPTSAAIENLQAGPEAAYKAAILTAPILAAGPIAESVGADEMSGLGRQITQRSLAGAGMAAPAVASGASPKDIATSALTGAAFPIGERGEVERPLSLREEDYATPQPRTEATTQTVAPESRPRAEDSQNISPATASEVSSDQSALRHVDVQKRRVRGDGKGQFRSETRAEREQRLAQVNPVETQPEPSVSTQIETPTSPKEPWQMSRDEYKQFASDEERARTGSIGVRKPSSLEKEGKRTEWDAIVDNWRRSEIEDAIAAGKPVPPEVLADYPDLAPASPQEGAREGVPIVTDAHDVQEIRNSIAEGQLTLRTGSFNGRKLSPDELLAVRRQVESDQARIGESRVAGKSSDYTTKDVTPEGYGPIEEAKPSEPQVEPSSQEAATTPESVTSPTQSEIPKTTGIAKRVEESRRGTSAPSGEGISAKDSVERGRQLLAEGKSPEEATKAFQDSGAVSAEGMALVRAKHEELAKQANLAFDKHGIDSPEFKKAEKARQDYWENDVRPMQTAWSNTGRAQQGETAIDTGTFYGLYKAFKQETGREPTPKEIETAKQVSSRVASADKNVQGAQRELVAQLDRATGIKDLPDEVQGAIRKFIDQSRRESRTQRRQQTRKVLDDEAATIKTNLAAAFQKVKSQTGIQASGLARIDPEGEITKLVVQYAKNRAKAGITDAAQLIDDVHATLKDFADVTKREVAEALTGVGIPKREVKPSEWLKVKNRIRQGLKAEDQSVAEGQLRGRVRGRISPEDAKTIWRYTREKYIDKGVEIGDAIQSVAKDLETSPDQIRRAVASQPRAKPLTDEVYRQMAARRQARAAAENWVKNADRSPAVKALEGVRDAFFNIKTFGHGTVGPITHAGKNLFIPERWADYFKNTARTWKAAYSTAAHERMMQDLVNDSNYITARRAGLANEPGKFYDDYQNTQMQKLFGAIGKIGNRGFDVLKAMRQDFFNSQWNKLPDGMKTPETAKAIADIANHATGAIRTQIPFNNLAKGVFFAPSLEGSRWATMFGDPARAINAFSNWSKASPSEKYFAKQIVKQHSQFLGTYVAALALNQGILSATGSQDKVNFTDPSKSDWLRLKIAGRAIEPTGGIISTIDFLGKIAAASLGPKRRGESRYETMGKAGAQYARGKLSPLASTVTDVATQSDFSGRPLPFSSDEGTPSKPRYSWSEYFLTQHTPIPVSEAVRDINSTLAQQGVPHSTAKAIVKGLIVGGISGGTGVRIGTEYGLNPNVAQKQQKQGFQERFLRGAINENDLDRAAQKGELTESDINSILKEKDIQDQYTPFQAAFLKAPTLTANKTSTSLDRFERMNELQRAQVSSIMQDKADAILDSDALTVDQKKAFADRIKAVGLKARGY